MSNSEKSWPSLALPPVSVELPPLLIATQSGEVHNLSQNSIFRMYVCGITPYDATHLGHAATYLTFDLINRYLQLSGRRVDFVENITDIDDPLFERAKRDNKSWKELGESQVALFTSDMSALRILPPKNYVSVTDSMLLIIEAIEKLVTKGHTYELAGNVYFRISQFLSQLDLPLEEALEIFSERGGDPTTTGKENPLDPIVWLGNKDGEPGWSSQMGFGRPGWHVECSVIALYNLVGSQYLEEGTREAVYSNFELDLQGGGSDLKFPHHFMTAAIGKALSGRSFARSYVHAGMVGLDGEKMSKSKGNLVLVSNLLKQEFDAMEIRFALLASHYAEDRMWHQSVLLDSRLRVSRIRSALSRTEVAPTNPIILAIAASIGDNLNTPLALEIVDGWVSDTEKGLTGGSVGDLSRFLDAVLGLAL